VVILWNCISRPLEIIIHSIASLKTGSLLSAGPDNTDIVQREHSQILGRIGVGYKKVQGVRSMHKCCNICEMGQDRAKVINDCLYTKDH